ncbi:5-formyltetrahydrofolate cyclo-ligase [Arabiibacter massiliensis]|uniref:5-formyltetrahydrofolate cyclo-ligase n=1 Tax=Arabiibacter massiliensis TaxID=1870985 RepID=UPI001E3682F2|nr:5-formyltetrahydrofolate cyclo-ligase [Arabiibacter massiliensis]
MEEKTALREQVLARRDAIPNHERARRSAAACRRLEELVEAACAQDAPAVAVYAAMRSEVDLGAFIDALCVRGWRACFPCMVRDAEGAPARMAFYQVPAERLERAREEFLDKPLRCHVCGELEDAGYEPVAPEELDAVAVPLVAFDDAGRRLGYGGGNYDRLLPRVRPDALVVGVAFEEQRVEAVPCEPHDMPLPRVVRA